MRKPHMPTLRAHVHCTTHAFLCNYGYLRCSLPPLQVCTRHLGTPCIFAVFRVNFYCSEYTRSTCSLKSQGIRSLVGLITSAGTGEYFPPLQFTCRNCGGGDRGRVAIYRPFGEFRRAKSYCHLYGAQGQRQAYLLPMPR
ncbi:hypothetical protein TNCV_4378011 [Trichonephila clavipes]|nr:hypothetical protein TNCV_4378011 [Trichonephila clavipes]